MDRISLLGHYNGQLQLLPPHGREHEDSWVHPLAGESVCIDAYIQNLRHESKAAYGPETVDYAGCYNRVARAVQHVYPIDRSNIIGAMLGCLYMHALRDPEFRLRYGS